MSQKRDEEVAALVLEQVRDVFIKYAKANPAYFHRDAVDGFSEWLKDEQLATLKGERGFS